MQLCGYSSRIVSLLGMGVHSPLLNMLPLRIPTWAPQDSVYLVTNIRVAQSRMPRPRYTLESVGLTSFDSISSNSRSVIVSEKSVSSFFCSEAILVCVETMGLVGVKSFSGVFFERHSDWGGM